LHRFFSGGARRRQLHGDRICESLGTWWLV
jgi:hypothetical protein